MKKLAIYVAFLSFSTQSILSSDSGLLDISMNELEFEAFKERVGKAVANHPSYKSSEASLRAAYAQVEGTKSSLRPQIKLILDSNNAISRKYASDPSNLVERSRSDHKTNARFSLNQLLYDFGATQYDVSRTEALSKASRAELSNTIQELLYSSIRSYIDVASYRSFQDVVESSYLRHKSIKELIQKRFDSGMSAGRELSRAQAREAEALAKLTSVKQNLGIAISRFRIYFPDGELPEKLPSYPFNLNNRTLEESRNSMFKKNPNILQANEQYLASSYKTKNARASSLPRLDLEVTKTHYNVTKESEEFDTFAGVNLTYDIFTGGRDEAYKKHHMWVRPKLQGLPSDYYRAHGAATFQEDEPGLALAESSDLVDNFMWANDYPHHEGTWPHSAEAIERTMGELTEDARAKILGLNAARFFGFDVPL